MTCLEAALIVLALGAALPAIAHTLLEARLGLHRPLHWLTMRSAGDLPEQHETSSEGVRYAPTPCKARQHLRGLASRGSW